MIYDESNFSNQNYKWLIINKLHVNDNLRFFEFSKINSFDVNFNAYATNRIQEKKSVDLSNAMIRRVSITGRTREHQETLSLST